MSDTLNLHAYFDRIGWGGGTLPTMATLAGLLAAHTARIPFENLDALLRRPVRLDLAGLQEKLVAARRGGYCFEHATLFAAVLEALGFDCVRHSGRVVIFTPPALAPRGHMFLTVTLEGRRYAVDPGFGLFGSRVPLPLDGTPTGFADGPPTHRLAAAAATGRSMRHARARKSRPGCRRWTPRTQSISTWPATTSTPTRVRISPSG